MSFITRHKALGHVDRLARWKAGEKPAPVTIEWDLSNRCALGCTFCHFAHTHTRGPWVNHDRRLPMAFETPGDLADRDLLRRAIPEVAAAGVEGIIWSGGGDPLTHPNWDEQLGRAHAAGLQQGMYTFGGLIVDNLQARTLAAYCTWIVVSLDAADADTYAADKRVDPSMFRRACDGVNRLMQAGGLHVGADVGASFLLHAGNVWQAGEMVKLARKLGATYASLRPIIDTHADNPAQPLNNTWARDPKVLQYLEQFAADPFVEIDVNRFRQYGEWSGNRHYEVCHGIKLNATITPDGRVWVCPQRRGIEGSCVGDLRTESFTDLWQRHPGQWTDFSQCRAMCRLHLTNQAVAPVFGDYKHGAFV